jgi:amidase
MNFKVSFHLLLFAYVLILKQEYFHLKGYDACNGYISRTFNPSTATTYAIELVKAARAIVICKDKIPQTRLVAEAQNNVFG